jgi:CRP-like cAMP-binding protein
MLWSVVVPLFDFWLSRGYWGDGIVLLQQAVQDAPPDDSSSYAQALIGLGTLLALTGHVAEALPYADEGYRRALMTGEPNTIAMAEQHMGMLVGEAPARERHFQAALAACRQANNHVLLASTLLLYGDYLREQGALDLAHAMYMEMLAHARALNDDTLTIYPVGNLGRLALLDGDIERAMMLFSESVALARAKDTANALADWLLRLGVVHYYRQEVDAAYATLTECVSLAEGLNHWRCLPNARMWLAAATLAHGDATAAKQLLQMSLAGYGNRLRSPASAYPSAAEVVEALVIAAYINATQHHGEEAATALGCAETLRAQACAPSDPFLIAMADHVREQLTRNMDPDALYNAMEGGRTTSALACFTMGISETNSIAHNSNTVEQ